MKVLNKIISKILIFFVLMYQKILSPYIPSSCRYTPTCSTYMIESLKKYGIFKGSYLGIIRILKCNPFNSGGYDPVP